ncbi:MAG: ATPase involved in DNA repair, partial [uncultured Paraburkholderia sp.]
RELRLFGILAHKTPCRSVQLLGVSSKISRALAVAATALAIGAGAAYAAQPAHEAHGGPGGWATS